MGAIAAGPRRAELRSRVMGALRDDRTWLAAALLVSLLIGWGGDDASPLGWLNPVSLAIVLAARWRDATRGERRLRTRAVPGTALVVAGGWAVAMVYEATLSAAGDGYGGMHPDTVPSFVIAQGFYVPLAAFTVAAVRRYGLDTRRAFVFAGASAWYEALTVGAVAMLSPAFPFAPLLAAYYVSTYALFGMAGLLVVDHRGIARRRPVAVSTGGLALRGAVAGALCWGTFLAWSEIASRAFGFDLP